MLLFNSVVDSDFLEILFFRKFIDTVFKFNVEILRITYKVLIKGKQ